MSFLAISTNASVTNTSFDIKTTHKLTLKFWNQTGSIGLSIEKCMFDSMIVWAKLRKFTLKQTTHTGHNIEIKLGLTIKLYGCIL